MKKIPAVLFIIFPFLFPITETSAENAFSLKPKIYYNIGTSNYTLKAAESSGTIYKSTLEFPTDAVMAGGSAVYSIYESLSEVASSDRISTMTGYNHPLWQFTLSAYINLSNKGGTMKDSDWYGTSLNSMVKFSYTESSVKKTITFLELRGSRQFKAFNNSVLSAFAGFRYQEMTQDIYGVEGWQIDISDPGLPRTDFDLDGHFLYYNVKYNIPYAGLEYSLKSEKGSELNLSAAGAIVIASDYDDHFERNKFSEGEGTGWGALSSVEYSVFANKSRRVKFSFFGEFDYYFVPAQQRQEWYGDDPASDGDETGQVFSGINYEFESWHINFGIKTILMF